MVVVQGDTTTTLCGALAGFYAGTPVAHVEAGLRTGDMRQPFPEEVNRAVVTRLADLHFAATAWAADNPPRRKGRPRARCGDRQYRHRRGNAGVRHAGSR